MFKFEVIIEDERLKYYVDNEYIDYVDIKDFTSNDIIEVIKDIIDNELCL